MAFLKNLFMTEVEMLDQAYEDDRVESNKKSLGYAVLVFAAVQIIYLAAKLLRIGGLSYSETLFNGVFIFLTLAVYFVLRICDEIFYRVGVFLTLTIAALYSCYGSYSGLGEYAFILMLILVSNLTVDAPGFRISSTLSGLIYIFSSIAQWRFTLAPLGNILSVLLILAVLWVKSERDHLHYNAEHKYKEVIESMDKQIEFEKDYREVITEKFMESEHKFRVFMNRVPAAIIILDEGKITYANSYAVDLTGYSREELEMIDWVDLVDFEDAIKFHDILSKDSMEDESFRDYSVRILCKDNKPLWTKLVVTDIKHNMKSVKLITGYSIKDQKYYETQMNRFVKMKEDMLVLTQSILGIDDLGILFDIILDSAIDSVEMADRGSILLVGEDGNLYAEAFVGYKGNLMKKLSLPVEESFLYLKTAGQLQRTEIINDISRLKGVKMADVQEANPNEAKSTIGAPIYYNGNLYGMIYLDSPIRNAFKEEDFMMVDFLKTQLEMAVNKQALMEETVYLSRYDKLTGVFNRRWFEEYYQTMEAKATRYGDHFAFVMFDLNGLKYINDTYGHLEGDVLIRGFAERLKATTRSSDVLARYGGDEFVAIFHEIDEQNLQRRMKELDAEFYEKPIKGSENEIFCKFSYGAAFFGKDSRDYESLVRIADERMYAMKSDGDKSYVK